MDLSEVVRQEIMSEADESVVRRYKETNEILKKHGFGLKPTKLTREILRQRKSVRQNIFAIIYESPNIVLKIKKYNK